MLLDPLLETHSFLLDLVVFLPDLGEIEVGGVVLSFVGLQGLHSQLVQALSSEVGQISVSAWTQTYLTPRVTELSAASLKDSSGS
jgi:hypothetical protein